MASSPDPIAAPSAKPNRPNSPRTSSNNDSECDLEKLRTQSEDRSQSHRERHSVFEDVTIPANILRYVNTAKEWTPLNELVGTQDHHQADSSSNFNVVDIALEQQAVIDHVLGSAPASQARRSSRTNSIWNHGQAVNWRQNSLPTLDEEKKDEAPRRKRRSTSGMQAIRTTQRRSYGERQGQNNLSLGPQSDNHILFRSLNSYALRDADGIQLRRLSSAIAPDADYLAPYEGSLEEDDQSSLDDSMHEAREEIEQPPNSSAIRRISVGMATLYQTVTQKTTNLTRMTTLRNAYENAKIRGKHLERKKWVQLTFEYTFYLILLSFVYFVLVGRPLWNGAVWWLYWLVHTHFTVAGTWSTTIGLAIM